MAIPLLAGMLILASCTKNGDHPYAVLKTEALDASDIETFGEYPGLSDSDNQLRSAGLDADCDEYFIFRREDERYRLKVTCYPYFNFDSVFAYAPVNWHAGETTAGSVSGNFHMMWGERPNGLPWRDAVPLGVTEANTYMAPFSCHDPDGDGLFQVTLEHDGSTYVVEDVKVEITNRTDEGTHVYRVFIRAPGFPNNQYYTTYWQDLDSGID